MQVSDNGFKQSWRVFQVEKIVTFLVQLQHRALLLRQGVRVSFLKLRNEFENGFSKKEKEVMMRKLFPGGLLIPS